MDKADSKNETRLLQQKKFEPFRANELPASISVPEHQMLRRIGHGSYGEVWLARNSMGTFRAVKIVFRKSFESERPFERELSGIRKFEPVSRLHPGFIDVLQVGINAEEGYFYYIMELGDDQRLGQQIDPASYVPNTLAAEISRRGKLPLQECLQLGIALTHALAELHKHGLVHRDIKPSNIIFVDGLPKLADIGLVANVHEARSYVGTEGFIPPEGPGTPQADIYSFGKVLYEASTGRDRHDFPEMPTHWGQSPDYTGLLELNEIILEACRLNPTDRYSTAWDMHADLLVLVNGKSVRRLKALERRWRNVQRAAGIMAVILGIAGAGSYEIYREWRNAVDARQRSVRSNVTYGTRAMDSGDLLGALPYFAEAARLEPNNQDHRLRFGSVLSQCPKLTQMWLAPKRINNGQFSPDGKNVLLAEFYGNAGVYALETGRLYEHTFGPGDSLHSANYSADGRFVITSSEANTSIIWDARTLSEVARLPHTNKVYTSRFSPDGRLIATACKDGLARIWDARNGQLKLSLGPLAEAVVFADFSHDGQLVVTASRDGTARTWRVANGAPAGPPLPHSRWVTWAAFSQDDRQVVTACDDHNARVWDFETGVQIRPDLHHNGPVRSVEYSPDGRLILTASLDGTARLWRAHDLQPFGSDCILRHGEQVTDATFSPDGRLVLTSCTDGSARVWDLAGISVRPRGGVRSFCRDTSRYLTTTNGSFQVLRTSDDHAVSAFIHVGEVIEHAQLSTGGSLALTVSSDHVNGNLTNRLAQIWDVDNGKLLGPAITVLDPLKNAVLSEDGQQVLIYGGNLARLCDPRKGTILPSVMKHDAAVGSAQFSPRNDLIATVSAMKVYVWQSVTGRPAFPPFQHRTTVSHVEFSRDGQYLVTCCADDGFTKCSAKVWNATTGQPVGDELTHADGVLYATFSRDGKRVATASEDFTTKVWDLPAGRQIGLPLIHAEQVNGANFSFDGKWVATASGDHTARVWEPETSDPLTPALMHLAPLTEAKFLQDGRHLLTADEQGRTFMWLLPVDDRPAAELVELAAFLAGGQFIPRATKQLTDSSGVVWQRLRGKYPEAFSTTQVEIIRWHEFQAEESEAEGAWAAAAFHLEILLKLKPGEAVLARDLARVKEHLKKD
jgi:WD40 repeat protein